MYPFIRIFGFHVGTYGLLMMLALLVAFLVLWRVSRRRGVRFECSIVLAAMAFGFALVGGYVLYMLASVGIPTIVQLIREGRAAELLTTGGIVFYGGLIGGFFGAWLGCRLVGLRFLVMTDFCAPALAIAHAIGRVGCLLAGCCYGRPCDLPFCFPLSPDIAGGQALFPVQLAEALCDGILFCVLLVYLRKDRPVTRAAGIYLMSYAVYRFVLEFFRYDEIRGHMGALSTSQWISIPVFLLGGLFVFVVSKKALCADPFRTPQGMRPDFRPEA